MFERMTDRARRAVNVFAQTAAKTTRASEVQPVHLLAGLLKDETTLPAEIMRRYDVTLAAVTPVIMELLGCSELREPSTVTEQLPMSAAMKEIVDEKGPQVTRDLKHNYVGTEHLLLALLGCPDAQLRTAWEKLKVDPAKVREDICEMMGVEVRKTSQDLGQEVPEGDIREKLLKAMANPVAPQEIFGRAFPRGDEGTTGPA